MYSWDGTLYNITVSAVDGPGALAESAAAVAAWLDQMYGAEESTQRCAEGTARGAERLLDELLSTAGIHESVRTIPHDPQWEFAAARVPYDGTHYDVDVRVAPDERIPRPEEA
jgi:hypothetical protein